MANITDKFAASTGNTATDYDQQTGNAEAAALLRKQNPKP